MPRRRPENFNRSWRKTPEDSDPAGGEEAGSVDPITEDPAVPVTAPAAAPPERVSFDRSNIPLKSRKEIKVQLAHTEKRLRRQRDEMKRRSVVIRRFLPAIVILGLLIFMGITAWRFYVMARDAPVTGPEKDSKDNVPRNLRLP